MSLESTVGIAKVGTKSLRATVPEGIVAFLGLQEGDKLEWRMEVHDNERAAVVTKKFEKNRLELAKLSVKETRKKQAKEVF